MQPELTEFLTSYERANNSHVWANVAPFIAEDAAYWFSDGSYKGVAEIRSAIEATFAKIQDEVYKISDVSWPVATDAVAVCAYRFHWQGIVGGQQASGSGRGTNVLEKRNGLWQIVHEHLSA
ncbi:MAG TPA: nuclear transport factor 2 family protein [Candidatus Saccharimonadia bacterium]|nr:nuclear transport factor 2 family protein [Candidatus Saccharimonadia bacterium]